MRLLTKLLFSVIVVIAAIWGSSLFLPTNLQLERTVVLHATPEQVYTLLNNPTEWERWSPVNKTVDPTMIRLYSGPMSGVGAKMQWSGDKVGNGQVELIESIAPEKINYKERETGSVVTIEGAFTLSATEGSTVVNWSQKAQLQDRPLARLKGVWLKYKKQSELEEGLHRLKSSFESSGNKKTEKRRVAVS